MENSKVRLKGVQETLLMPLWGRSIETQKKQPRLVDKEAVRIIETIDYDFTQIARSINPVSIAAWIARSIYFDQKITEYLEANPNGTIINIGCGLDTSYERVQNGRAMWYELDFPEVIQTRKLFINEAPNRKFLAYSVFDPLWYSELKNKENVLIMIAGVIYYFEENHIKKLFGDFQEQFKTSTVIFDYSSKKGMQIANKKVIEDGGMDASAYLKWGINDIGELEKWDAGITVTENMKMFQEHRKRYSKRKRIGMWISDALSIMSLAKITIA